MESKLFHYPVLGETIDEALKRRKEFEAILTPISEKDWTEDVSMKNGNYKNLCRKCQGVFVCHKKRLICKVCTMESKKTYEKLRDGAQAEVIKSAKMPKQCEIIVSNLIHQKLYEWLKIMGLEGQSIGNAQKIVKDNLDELKGIIMSDTSFLELWDSHFQIMKERDEALAKLERIKLHADTADGWPDGETFYKGAMAGNAKGSDEA